MGCSDGWALLRKFPVSSLSGLMVVCGFMWLSGFMWLNGCMWLSGFMWLCGYVAKSDEKWIKVVISCG